MKIFSLTLLTMVIVSQSISATESFTEALISGKANVDLRLRSETVEQDNSLKDADALTLRTLIGYTTGNYKGFSAKVEMEDVTIVGGVDEFTVGPTGFNPGEYSVIADPETTEIDQAFIKYQTDAAAIKYGRQVIIYDNHRFVGHVGWRQDRQTYDALNIMVTPVKDLELSYSYLTKRNRIFAKAVDVSSKDNLLNVSYKSKIGKLVGYAYLLEVDNNTDNALDTYGFRLNGPQYTVEYATQESTIGATKFEADYLFVEGGLLLSGHTVKLGYEVLGSDNAGYGFSTPLATVHKFNGWSDQFLITPAQGLVDSYLLLGGKLMGGKWSAVYHAFEADDTTATVDDLGSEINLSYAAKFNKIYNAGIKYASYSAGDAAAGKVDTDKVWLWVGVVF